MNTDTTRDPFVLRRYIVLATKNLRRRPMRTGLTVAGVALAAHTTAPRVRGADVRRGRVRHPCPAGSTSTRRVRRGTDPPRTDASTCRQRNGDVRGFDGERAVARPVVGRVAAEQLQLDRVPFREYVAVAMQLEGDG